MHLQFLIDKVIAVYQEKLSLSEVYAKVLTQESTMIAWMPSPQHVYSVFKIMFIEE